jgi:hypothetical protein
MTSVVTSASIQVINGHNPKSGKRMLNIESAWLIWTLIHSNVLLFNADFLILFDVSWCVLPICRLHAGPFDQEADQSTDVKLEVFGRRHATSVETQHHFSSADVGRWLR